MNHSIPTKAIENCRANPRALKTYAKITYADGEWCICNPIAVEEMTTGCKGFTLAEVHMTEAEFDELPEFQG